MYFLHWWNFCLILLLLWLTCFSYFSNIILSSYSLKLSHFMILMSSNILICLDVIFIAIPLLLFQLGILSTSSIKLQLISFVYPSALHLQWTGCLLLSKKSKLSWITKGKGSVWDHKYNLGLLGVALWLKENRNALH